jgi:hypothetical protein
MSARSFPSFLYSIVSVSNLPSFVQDGRGELKGYFVVTTTDNSYALSSGARHAMHCLQQAPCLEIKAVVFFGVLLFLTLCISVSLFVPFFWTSEHKSVVFLDCPTILFSIISSNGLIKPRERKG